MRDSVRAGFVPFTVNFEGRLGFMYLDVLGYVTTGIGNLIDPIGAALGLPWQKPDGSQATRDEIATEWRAVDATRTYDKGHPQAGSVAMRGGAYYSRVTSLRLTPDAVDALVLAKLDQIDGILAHRFPGYPDWPADAQLGVLSMSWACGAGFHFPMFEAAVNHGNFDIAALQSHMADEHNPGLVHRNAANRTLFANAARVVQSPDLYDPAVLYYPKALPHP